MIKKMMLLALTVVSAAALAGPSIAAAEDFPLHMEGTALPIGFTVKGTESAKLSTTTGETISCAGGDTGSGEFETGTTGWMELTFHTCTTIVLGFPVNCTTSGQPTGTITTTKMPFHLDTLPDEKPGILVTPSAEGSFAHFACGGVNVTVEGNGVIGKITNPACGATSPTATVDFNATAHGVQEYTTIKGTETEYKLTKGGNTAAEDAIGTMTLNGAAEGKLNCT